MQNFSTEDNVPWLDADPSHHIMLAGLHRHLGASRDGGHKLLSQGPQTALWEVDTARRSAALRPVLQGHTGPFLHRPNVWRGVAEPFGSTAGMLTGSRGSKL